MVVFLVILFASLTARDHFLPESLHCKFLFPFSIFAASFNGNIRPCGEHDTTIQSHLLKNARRRIVAFICYGAKLSGVSSAAYHASDHAN